MIEFLKKLFAQESPREDFSPADLEQMRLSRELSRQKQAEEDAKYKVLSQATNMIGVWGWNYNQRPLREIIANLRSDCFTKAHLFSQYTERLYYLVKEQVNGMESRRLYVAQGAWQLNAAYAWHAQAGLDSGHEVACCLVPADYQSVMPLLECPFPPPIRA